MEGTIRFMVMLKIEESLSGHYKADSQGMKKRMGQFLTNAPRPNQDPDPSPTTLRHSAANRRNQRR